MPLICSSTFPPISFSSLLLCVQSGLTRGRGGVRGDQGAHTGQEISNFKPKYCLKSKGVGGMSKIKSRVLNVSQSQLIMGSVCTAQQGSWTSFTMEEGQNVPKKVLSISVETDDSSWYRVCSVKANTCHLCSPDSKPPNISQNVYSIWC